MENECDVHAFNVETDGGATGNYSTRVGGASDLFGGKHV